VKITNLLIDTLKSSNKIIFLFLIFVLTTNLLFSESLSLLYMNDLHGHLYPWVNSETGIEYGGVSRLKTLLDNERNDVNDSLFLLAGDMVTGSASTYLDINKPDWNRIPTYGYRGIASIEIMNFVGLDALAVGNHELDWGFSWFEHYMDEANFSVLSANIQVNPIPKIVDPPNSIIQPYRIFKLPSIRIGVIGLTTNEYIKSTQVKIIDPISTAQNIIKDISDSCDIIIVLSHLGFDEDIKLAGEIPEIDIIIGGHSHTQISTETFIGKTLIVQAAEWGKYLGRILIEHENGKILDIQSNLIRNDFSILENEEVTIILDGLKHIGYINETIESNHTVQSSLGKYINEAIIMDTQCDIVLHTSKKYNGIINEGLVSAEDFFNIFWPYRSRDLGAEKDISIEQIMFMTKNTTSTIVKSLIRQSKGLQSLIGFTVPYKKILEIEALNDTNAGRLSYLQISYNSDFNIDQDTNRLFSAVVDITGWKYLIKKGIIDNSMDITLYSSELFEVVFERIRDLD
jgi:5'-nucleotidase / UDP-sugar diphosphatase